MENEDIENDNEIECIHGNQNDTTDNDSEDNTNANTPGKNNGINMWIAAHTDDNATHEDKSCAQYARRNADNSRFYDIDDVPSCGPRKSHKEIKATAQKLVNKTIPTYICRSTGIRVHQELSDVEDLPPNRRR